MNVLITGVSSGLGKEVLSLRNSSFAVYGVSRNPLTSHVFSYDSIETLPSPEVLILNAAIGDQGVDFRTFDAEAFKEIMDVNLMQPLSYFSTLYRSGKLSNLKQLLIIGSRFSSPSYIQSQEASALPGYGYCISKASLALFVQVLRKESFPFSVNLVHPGVMNTVMGSPEGINAGDMAQKLQSKILDDSFLHEFNGIYALPTDEIIPF
jgi:NAD(P)-dependent dehydrogenase (short-subunit alcohol dehydrogenase family)